jgi:hypothetical protein
MTKRLLVPAVALALVVAMAGAAAAFWSSSGSGNGFAKAGAVGLPSNPTAFATSASSINIFWGAPNSGATVTEYRVYRDGGATPVCQGTTATTCDDTGLSPSTTYSYTVESRSGQWTSGLTSTVSATTDGVAAVQSFLVSAGVGTKTANVPFDVTITAQANGATDGTYTGSHAITFSGPSGTPTYPPSVSFSGGVGTASVTLTANETVTLNATDGSRSGSTSVTVGPAAPTPTVTNVTSTAADASYRATSSPVTSIPVTVAFSEAVTVAGTPTLSLATGSPASTAVAYTSGSGTTTLTFTYTVAVGNSSSDLDYVSTSALVLAGGATITSAASGSNATLTLPTPGATGSLGFNKAIVIDTTSPSVQSIAFVNGGATGTLDDGDSIVLTFSESLAVSTICSSWSGNGSNQTIGETSNNAVTLTVTSGDVLSVATTECGTLRIGDISLGANYNSDSKDMTFKGNDAGRTWVRWNAAARQLTIHIGSKSGGNGTQATGVAANTASYIPTAGITDVVGNGLPTTIATTASQRF